MKTIPPGRLRPLLGLLSPLLALAVQWVFWPSIRPFAWFLFYPAVFFSSWIGGVSAGLAATAISIASAWWFFIPPEYSLAKETFGSYLSAGVFLAMGVLFSVFQGRLQKANRRVAEALEAVQQTNERLQEANESITRLYRRTRELDELKTQFFANVSHELRTPLALILGPVAKRLGAPDLGDGERRDLELVERSARLLYRHVCDLLDVAKLEAGRMDLHYATVDLAALVRFVTSHFEVLAKEKSILYTIDAPEALPAQVDAEKCQRILLNLLSNAFKFTPAGGTVAMTLHPDEDQGSAVLSVRDSGPGVPPALREAVFERFRQGEGGADRRRGGTGLGLAIAREFAGLHGGTVAVGDAQGGGALFTVTLPLKAPEGAEIRSTPSDLDEELELQALDELNAQPRNPAPPLPATPAVGADAPLVLVVEDNPDMNAFVAEALGRHHRVATAFDGEDGLAKAIALRPDLIVSDVMMPRMSGPRMVKALRRRPETAEVPIVILTAKSDDELRVQMLREGVQDYLNKPFVIGELLARVDGLIAERGQIRDVRAQLAAIVESSEDAIVGETLEGVITSWNAGAEKLFGYTAEEAAGESVLMLFPPDKADEERKILSRIAPGERSEHVESVRLRKDGKRIHVAVTISPIRDGQGRIIGASKIARDITARKRAEAALRESEARARMLFDTSPLAMLVINARRTIVQANGCADDLFGYPPGKLIGLSVEALVPERFRARHPALVSEYFQHPEPRQLGKGRDLQGVRADGEEFPCEISLAPFGMGDELHVIASIVDITRRKQAEAEILRLNADLERRVEARTAELQAANRELESFAYAVSHDLRAPLRAMSGFSQALVEDYGDRLEGEARVYLDQIVQGSRRMGELIDGLLTLSRCTRGELRREEVDLSALAHRIRDELARSEPGRQVDWRIEPGLLAQGDPRMLEAVMRNLIGNAWKYTIRAKETVIRVYSEQDGENRLFCIGDNGAGFDMAHAGKLFQPFQRLHRQEEFQGLGIGLATVQRIIHRHGGTIAATAAPGQGARFCFTLPFLDGRDEEDP